MGFGRFRVRWGLKGLTSPNPSFSFLFLLSFCFYFVCLFLFVYFCLFIFVFCLFFLVLGNHANKASSFNLRGFLASLLPKSPSKSFLFPSSSSSSFFSFLPIQNCMFSFFLHQPLSNNHVAVFFHSQSIFFLWPFPFLLFVCFFH